MKRSIKNITVLILAMLCLSAKAQSSSNLHCKDVVTDMIGKMTNWLESGEEGKTLHLKYRITAELRGDDSESLSSTAEMFMRGNEISMRSNEAEVFIDSSITITHLPNHKIIQLAGTPNHQIRADRVMRYTAKFDSIIQYATVVGCSEVTNKLGKQLLHVEMEVSPKGQQMFKVFKMETWIDQEKNWIVKSKATHTLFSKLQFVEFEYLDFKFENETSALFTVDAREKFFKEDWVLKPQFAQYKFMDGRK